MPKQMPHPPEHLPDIPGTPAFKAESLKLADEFAKPGTVMHFALRLGFMPHNEAQAEGIIKRYIQECDWWQQKYENLLLYGEEA